MSEQNSNDFQDILNSWFQYKVYKFKQKVYVTHKKGHRFFNKDWALEKEKYFDMYYAIKAIYFKANINLPLSTLVQLGRKLSDENIKDEVKDIIAHNILKFEGQYIKLDDLDQQVKVRKILRTEKFEDFSREYKRAA